MPRPQRPVRRTVVRYVDPTTGERVAAGTPGAKRIKAKTATWYYSVKGRGGKQRYVSLDTDDEGQAWANLRRRLAGLDDGEHAKRQISEHVAEWLECVQAAGASAAHVALLRTRMTQLVAVAGWRRIGDVTAGSCQIALRNVTADGLSAQTRNHYLSHAKQFARWLWENGRLPSHPLLRLEPVSIETDRRHDRRIPTDEEVATLLSANLPDRKGMSGPQRQLGYRVCMATGLRAGELRSLSRESFDLDGGTVVVQAAYSKRRRKDTLPIPPWLVDELRAWFAAGGECWPFPAVNPGRVLQFDLRRCGIPLCVDKLYFDFHSLRHWYITWAANQPGISPKTLMALARHSTPQLTLKVYAKVRGLDDLKKQVNELPDLSGNRIPK